MGMSSSSGSGSMSDINITPYIDILLVLLIIFMVIQPTTQYDLKARTPEKQDEDVPEDIIIKSEAIVLQIFSDGSYSINREAVTLDLMGEKLFEIYSARSNKNMFIQGESDLPFGDVIRVIDIAKGAGVGDIGLLMMGGPAG